MATTVTSPAGCLSGAHWADRGLVPEETVDAYDQALAIGPVYPEAIEERGEICPGLDRVDDARDAYMKLAELAKTLSPPRGRTSLGPA